MSGRIFNPRAEFLIVNREASAAWCERARAHTPERTIRNSLIDALDNATGTSGRLESGSYEEWPAYDEAVRVSLFGRVATVFLNHVTSLGRRDGDERKIAFVTGIEWAA